MTRHLQTAWRLSACLLTAACGGDSTGPGSAEYGLRLAGAVPGQAAAVVVLRDVPPGSQLTAAAGIVLHVRRSADGASTRLLLAGDLTRTPLLTFRQPRSAAQSGTVVELATEDGRLVEGAKPAVVFVER